MDKVNIFVRRFHSKGGGERVCFSFVNYLLRQGADVRVICGEDRLKDPAYKDILTVTGLMRPGRYLKYSSYHRRAGRIMDRLDGVHFSFERLPGCHIYRNGSGLHSSYVRGTLSLMKSDAAFKKRIERALNPINRYLISCEDKTYKHPSLQKIILNSEFLKREVLAVYPDAGSRIEIIPNGVDKSRYSLSNERPFREKYGMGGRVVIGFAANNFQRKGLDILLEALSLMDSRYALLAAGDRGSEAYMPAIRKYGGIEDRVFFTGEVEDMQGFYSSCDVLCLPSLYDSFGNVVPESLMAGTPVAVSYMAGSSEIVKDGENGYVIDRLDARTVADCIGKAAELGRRDFGCYVSSEDDMYGAYLDVIRQCAIR